MKICIAIIVVTLAAGCSSAPDGIANKVLQDFGIRERPEGYVSGSDKVFERLTQVGRTEIKRMNAEGRHGEVKFESGGGLRSKYYKEVKVYKDFYPLDSQPAARTAAGDHGYVGYIEYSYEILDGPRRSNRTEAAAEAATIPTGNKGRETYRYKFTAGSSWSGGKGEKVKR